jgi:hypothetical protein
MKKFIFSSLVFFTILVVNSSCKKDVAIPSAPEPPTNLAPTNSVRFTWKDSVVTLTSFNSSLDSSGAYTQVAYNGGGEYLLVEFKSGKPNRDSTYLYSSSTLTIGYYDSNKVYWMAYGPVMVTVNQEFVTTTFSDMNFSCACARNQWLPQNQSNNGSITTN